MRDELELVVWGTEPGPQGSKRHVGGGRLIEASKKVAPWRAAVAVAIAEKWSEELEIISFDTPVEVAIHFYLPKPTSVKRDYPSVPPDLDKLARSTLDGLVQGGALKDDSLVCRLILSKDYAVTRPIGASITIRKLGLWERWRQIISAYYARTLMDSGLQDFITLE